MRRLLGIIAATMLVFLAASPAHAQSQATTGEITGQVTDAQGGVLPGRDVTITNPDTGYTRTVTRRRGLYYWRRFAARHATT